MDTCVGCGAPVLPAEADFTAEGLRCRTCSLAAEAYGHARAVAAAVEARRSAAVRRRAATVARGHWIVWLGSVIVFCGVNGARHQAWFAPLALGVVVPLVGLLFEQAWAWRTLLGLDLLAAIALVGGALFSEWNGRLLLLLVAAVPALLAVGLVVELRSQRTEYHDTGA